MIIFGPWEKTYDHYDAYFRRPCVYNDTSSYFPAYVHLQHGVYICCMAAYQGIAHLKKIYSLEEAKLEVDTCLKKDGCILLDNDEQVEQYLALI